MNKYELSLVVDPNVGDADREALVGDVQKMLKAWGGVLEKTEEEGKKMLAYPIKKQTEAYYYFLTISLEPELVKDLDQKIKFEDKVIRHLIVKLDEK